MSALCASPVSLLLLLLLSPLIKSQMTDFIPLTLLTGKKGFEHKWTPAPTQASSQVTYSVTKERSNRRPAPVIGTSTELRSELCSLMAA